jgi:hypothetical protein
VEEAVIIPEVNELLEKRNRKSKSSGLDLDAFITDDNDGIQVSPIAPKMRGKVVNA